MRVHLACRRMSLREADILEYYLKNVPGVTAVKVFDRTQDAIITYQADRTALIRALAAFSFASEQAEQDRRVVALQLQRQLLAAEQQGVAEQLVGQPLELLGLAA